MNSFPLFDFTRKGKQKSVNVAIVFCPSTCNTPIICNRQVVVFSCSQQNGVYVFDALNGNQVVVCSSDKPILAYK